jgi:plasmid stabilization system protein ParE
MRSMRRLIEGSIPHPARSELRAAVRWYNGKRSGLGREFNDEVKRATKRIAEFPEAWPHISQNARRFLLTRFPYGLIYLVEGKTILIVAVMHLSRNPITWQRRLEEIEGSPR